MMEPSKTSPAKFICALPLGGGASSSSHHVQQMELATQSATTASVVMMSPTTSLDDEDTTTWFTNVTVEGEGSSPVSLNPGKNRILLYSKAGSQSGNYTLNQFSVICIGEKLELVSAMSRYTHPIQLNRNKL